MARFFFELSDFFVVMSPSKPLFETQSIRKCENHMHPNHELIQQFYEAFARGDSATMAAAYHPEARFSDPVFTALQGEQIGHMWSMLVLQAKTLEVEVKDVAADDREGQAYWTARYDFGKPPRPVCNKIKASFEFKDGKIIRHEDHFSFWRWSRMALGPLGLLLGWHGGVRKKVSVQAMQNLMKFTSKIKAE